ncbi:TIGR03557 family F420-dependent LLM class oxidoreductase [Actinacidiphila bryophytorum]|uniref:F420-dependent oxidoreductase, G6PDH family n=1 Tax=Actinacidiphila bryophytorum TaxID=1436133 RepID=A0A9W4MB90_9ACTN|nr:TIGR03557 family F420-dependent LLM class oxidoreductase [Actinacidiphila bryophytorum]MBM9436967.1 TIGR03557 family F420-dependent LLM class oxidoreductase [Actinacidiphila bryophytorum]MBN6542422.1 TIGR03557 family F420-dependent LLM class oxidoreductase [Actinacidiphila bryophytorum]CAG7646014.1 F420-dependent oxidoreductase, G6PDH family [Actinacidiphila bryophytorum]
MTRYGYFLSCEEFAPRDLLEQARMAEQAGFTALAVSDHYHPWIDEQGESPFVWSVIGALSQVTSLPVTTLVTCPTVRIHPAVNAQAAATAAAMLEGGFRFGIGTGEALNEHITGQAWPDAPVRMQMLEEAVQVIRKVFTGEQVTHRGPHYTVENARLYTRPDEPPPLYVSGFGPLAAATAGRVGDGFVTMKPDADLVASFRRGGGGDKPAVGGLKVCWDTDRDRAIDTVHRLWATEQLPGELNQILPTPEHFQQARTLVDRDTVAAAGTFGDDPDEHLAAVRAYAEADFDEVYVGQVGPDQRQFFDAYRTKVLPALQTAA